MSGPPLPIDITTPGIVGPRSLRVLQLVRIGRHPSTVLILPHAGIWMVSGRGPGVGSNGAGKTVLLGALSLLNGDSQWHGENGVGPNAAKLLFDHKRARLTDPRHQDAARGYIIGVFLDSAAPADAITVIMRIQRHENPYVQVRSSAGILIADGSKERDRFVAADAIWERLRGETSGPREYAEKLYGQSPRCLAYIRARGDEGNQDNGILALGRRRFRPADLADQIITLSGKREAVGYERQLRQELMGEESRNESRKREYAEQYAREERALAEIAARNVARRLNGEAAEQWRLFLLVGVVVEQIRADDLRHDVRTMEGEIQETRRKISDLEQRVAELPTIEELAHRYRETKQNAEDARKGTRALDEESGAVKQKIREQEEALEQLRSRAIPAAGLTVAEADIRLNDARTLEREAAVRESAARQDYDRAKTALEHLRAGRGGPAGPALDALQEEGIDACALVDLLTFTDGERPTWEARLSPYARTVIICREDLDRGSSVMHGHPGTPVLFTDIAVADLREAAIQDPGTLGGLLAELESRMPSGSRNGWVKDTGLRLHIPGSYEIPLTDREAAITAAESQLAELGVLADKAGDDLLKAEQRREAAERQCQAAQAAAEVPKAVELLAQLRRREAKLAAEEVPEAIATEDAARELHRAAKSAYEDAETSRSDLTGQISALKSGGEKSLTAQLSKLAEQRENARRQAANAEQWKQAASATTEKASEQLAVVGAVAGESSLSECFHRARTTLRHAIDAVAEFTRPLDTEPPDASSPETEGYGSYPATLDHHLRVLHQWCDTMSAPGSHAKSFTEIAKPLADWLTWHGESDASDEAEISENRVRREEEIAAFESQMEDTRQWIESQRKLQIQIITTMFRQTESGLNDLLDSVGQDRVRLGPRWFDVGDPTQPLRWELHPQWLPAGGEPTDYSLSPNTAELIILHVLLATSALTSASQTKGRMIILDESGNNLDGPNLSRIAVTFKKIAEAYGLTIVLACQDLYADRVAEHAAAMIQLLRPAQGDALNVPPAMIHGPDDSAVIDVLAPFLTLGRVG
jgi:hypothetical protein